jgi:hypothetical protein
MPTGLKASSATVAIGFSVEEAVANTFVEGSVDLNLSPLDREVFVVTAINIDPLAPDAIDGADTQTNCSLSSTSNATAARVLTLADANCLATANLDIRAGGATDWGVSFTRHGMEAPPATLDYIGIISTNDFYVQCKGLGNTSTKGCSGKVYGYRAVASADIYAALVQSEVLSA